MISVETKTFEIGVMRMIGLSKNGIVSMVIIQAFLFVLPALIIGIALSFPALFGIYKFLFEQNLGLKFEPIPSTFAFI
jgi:ABC-type antimicrobial peptide transport system permease subunit